MKTLGLLGGMSWESTVTYYRVLNETVKTELGGLHSAKILLASVDFEEIERCQRAGDWEKTADILGEAGAGLKRAGADLLLICTNTMHKVAREIEERSGLPLIHIADATADALLEAGIHKAALLGTRYTMLEDFYKARLLARGIEVLIPDEAGVETVHRVIYEELCLGIVSPASRGAFVRIIGELQKRGAEGVILGCTEIGLLIGEGDSPLPVFDTTLIHARRAALAALR